MTKPRRFSGLHLVAAPFAIAALAVGGTLVRAQEANAPLTVTVTGLKAAKGQLIACLWTAKPGFPNCAKSQSARRVTIPVSATSMRVSFPSVAPGRYAVTVEHDENGDGKMGHNLIGMPTEGVGISNNPGGMPGFDKSLFSVGAERAIDIKIRYLFG